MLLWVNLHGAFIVGFVIWGIYFVGESINVLLKWENADINQPEMKDALVKLVPPYLLTGVLSFFVTFLNPSGFQIWETSLGFLGNQYLVSHTAEYFPPNFHDPSTWPFLMMILFSLAILGLRRQRISWISLWMLVGWTAMGLYSVRNVPLYAVMIAPILAEFSSVEINFNHGLVGFKNLQMRLLKVETNLRGHVWPILVIFIFGVAAISGYRLDINEGENLFYEDVFPVNAVDWLEENPQSGKVFNYFPWGGYLLYRLWPSELVFIDGQTDFYGEALTREYEQIIKLTGEWESVLDKYHVTWILMPSESLLVKEFKDDPIWEEVFSDSTSSILVRSP
jgi:hypothetical protein